MNNSLRAKPKYITPKRAKTPADDLPRWKSGQQKAEKAKLQYKYSDNVRSPPATSPAGQHRKKIEEILNFSETQPTTIHKRTFRMRFEIDRHPEIPEQNRFIPPKGPALPAAMAAPFAGGNEDAAVGSRFASTAPLSSSPKLLPVLYNDENEGERLDAFLGQTPLPLRGTPQNTAFSPSSTMGMGATLRSSIGSRVSSKRPTTSFEEIRDTCGAERFTVIQFREGARRPHSVMGISGEHHHLSLAQKQQQQQQQQQQQAGFESSTNRSNKSSSKRSSISQQQQHVESSSPANVAMRGLLSSHGARLSVGGGCGATPQQQQWQRRPQTQTQVARGGAMATPTAGNEYDRAYGGTNFESVPIADNTGYEFGEEFAGEDDGDAFSGATPSASPVQRSRPKINKQPRIGGTTPSHASLSAARATPQQLDLSSFPRLRPRSSKNFEFPSLTKLLRAKKAPLALVSPSTSKHDSRNDDSIFSHQIENSSTFTVYC